MIPSPAFRLARLSFLAAALAAALPAAAETVDIASAADWAAFAGRVNGGETALNATMTADVTLGASAPRAGDAASHAYRGTFDGAGHTLTVDWSFGSTQHGAPFAFVKGCTIRDLRVAGSIRSAAPYAAGLIGFADTDGQTTVERCCVSAVLSSSVSGEAFLGGFLGETANSSSCKIDFRDCLFDGSLLGPSARACGGFAGKKYYSAFLWLHNCLFAPAELTVSPTDSHTFSHPHSTTPIDSGSNNYFYTRPFGTTQGEDVSSRAPETLASKLGANWTVSAGKVVLEAFAAAAGSPPEPAVEGFAYQGALNDISGTPLSGTKRIEFRLYDAATGGTPLWGRAHDVLLDGNGLFNVALADDSGEALEGIDSDPLPELLAASSASTLYAGLTVAGSEGEIAPRQRLLAVPYAAFAADAANASGPFAAAGKLSAGGLAVAGNATVQGNATFKGNLVARTNLTVSGAIRGRDDAHPAPGTVPRGAIVLWKGSSGTIPDGWALCDGSNGTPDLKGRFVVGYDPNDSDYYAVGRTGGETRHRLTTDQIPSHSHNTVVHTVGYSLSHNGDAEAATFDGYKRNNGNRDISGASTGGDQPHENRPPYYALCYIMRIK